MQTCTVKLDKSYKLSFGNKALRTYERDGGRSIVNVISDYGVADVTYLLHAGMVYDYPEITVDDIDEKMDAFLEAGGDPEAMMKALMDAVLESGWFRRANPTKAGKPSGKASGETPVE